MTTYYLLKKDGREFIDVSEQSGAELLKTTEAESWIEAKKDFGFDLTPGQAEISISNRVRRAA